jgi:hypothetical protein
LIIVILSGIIANTVLPERRSLDGWRFRNWFGILVFGLTFYITISKIDGFNSSVRLQVTSYLKSNPIDQIPVIISEIKGPSFLGNMKISLRKIKKYDKIPFNYFKLDNWLSERFKEGDTLHFIISKKYPNIFELKRSDGQNFNSVELLKEGGF